PENSILTSIAKAPSHKFQAPNKFQCQKSESPFEIWCLMLGASKASALALLVPRVGAYDVHASLAPHDLTVLANPLDACSDFHRAVQSAGGKATQYSGLRSKRSRAARTKVGTPRSRCGTGRIVLNPFVSTCW